MPHLISQIGFIFNTKYVSKLYVKNDQLTQKERQYTFVYIFEPPFNFFNFWNYKLALGPGGFHIYPPLIFVKRFRALPLSAPRACFSQFCFLKKCKNWNNDQFLAKYSMHASKILWARAHNRGIQPAKFMARAGYCMHFCRNF